MGTFIGPFQRIRVRQRSQLVPAGGSIYGRGLVANTVVFAEACYQSGIYVIVYSPQAPWCAPRSLIRSEDPMSFGAILISIAIGFGLILGACVLVFFGISAMAREARD
jgi:hypothetical protein